MRKVTARAWMIAAAALAVAAALPVHADEARSQYVVIIDPSNPERGADLAFLRDAFLKKVTRWPDGTVIKPVDQHRDSEIRKRFCAEILGRSVAAVRNYWQQVIFTGRGVPPPELDSEQEVVTFVAQHRGALGYVSPRADLSTVHVLAVR